MKTILVISPHLDDAVLSCGASLKKWASEGFHIHIQTIFSSAADESPAVLKSNYIRRRSDDLKACRLLDVEAAHSGFLDAPFRNQKYKDFSSILFHHILDDSALQQEIEKSLLTLCFQMKPDKVFFPLGVGGHVDHHLAFSCSNAILEKQFEVSYYEEFPYRQVYRWNQVRCSKTGILKYDQQIPSPVHIEPEFPSLQAQRLPFITNYITSYQDAERSEAYYQKELLSTDRSDPGNPVWLYSGRKFHRTARFIDEYLDLKCRAIAAYSTEWPALFGQAEIEIEKNLKHSHRGIHEEVFWKIL